MARAILYKMCWSILYKGWSCQYSVRLQSSADHTVETQKFCTNITHDILHWVLTGERCAQFYMFETLPLKLKPFPR